MKVLLTCFEPFGGSDVNVSSVVAQHFASLSHENFELKVELLPVSFKRVGNILSALITDFQPNIIVMLGQAGSREKITIERIAINLMDSKIGDNDNFTPNEQKIIESSENALFSNLPLKYIVENWQNAGIESAISNSAGLYVCNCSFYHALTLSREMGNNIKVGFIHLPKLPIDKSLHQPIIEKMSKAIDIAIKTN